MRIKETRICENGDFDVLVSFSKEDMKKIGIDTSITKDIMDEAWDRIRADITADDRRTW